jgi:hypothetical protein
MLDTTLSLPMMPALGPTACPIPAETRDAIVDAMRHERDAFRPALAEHGWRARLIDELVHHALSHTRDHAYAESLRAECDAVDTGDIETLVAAQRMISAADRVDAFRAAFQLSGEERP